MVVSLRVVVAPTQIAATKPFISTAVAEAVIPMDPPAGPSKLSTASIIGVITGGAAFILILSVSVVLWTRRRQKRYQTEVHEQQIAHPFMDWRSPTTRESKSGILGGQRASTVWQQYGSSEVSPDSLGTLTISWRPDISASPIPVEENPRENVPPYTVVRA
ncbi:hypothetical protein BDZ94DRAFT_1309385 [Collybia nuda]|uniref:Uncharacterized protein n=1 Tax=Collybia nuda TaxID=64659 RepID=A0A9P5Y3A3_9AGAR|nr:hypothetical protein BDZ94DRAFT_1309385 [Collybia nuda]